MSASEPLKTLDGNVYSARQSSRLIPAVSSTTLVALALAMIPFAYLVWTCIRLHVDVPFWDEWELAPRLFRLDAGTLTFHDLWKQHNEHRPLFPLLVMLSLAKMTAWNIGAEVAVNVLLALGIFAVCARALVEDARADTRLLLWLLPVVSLVVFSPTQWENWVWGWQMQIFMGVLAGAAGLRLLAGAAAGRLRLGAAMLCGVLSTYSFASGLVFWVAGGATIVMNPVQRRAGRMAAWAVVAAATIASYFYDFHPNPEMASPFDNFRSLQAVKAFVIYLAKYLGAPVAWYSPRLAFVAGVIGAITFAILALRLWRLRTTEGWLFAAALGLNAIGAASATALGRAALGTDQALASRYTTMSGMLWVAIGLLTAQALSRTDAPTAWRRRVVAAVATFVFTASVMSSAASGLVAAGGRHDTLVHARAALRRGTDADALLRLYPDLTRIRQFRKAIMQLHVSVFRD